MITWELYDSTKTYPRNAIIQYSYYASVQRAKYFVSYEFINQRAESEYIDLPSLSIDSINEKLWERIAEELGLGNYEYTPFEHIKNRLSNPNNPSIKKGDIQILMKLENGGLIPTGTTLLLSHDKVKIFINEIKFDDPIFINAIKKYPILSILVADKSRSMIYADYSSKYITQLMLDENTPDSLKRIFAIRDVNTAERHRLFTCGRYVTNDPVVNAAITIGADHTTQITPLIQWLDNKITLKDFNEDLPLEMPSIELLKGYSITKVPRLGSWIYLMVARNCPNARNSDFGNIIHSLLPQKTIDEFNHIKEKLDKFTELFANYVPR